jgi:hypothetical protein
MNLLSVLFFVLIASFSIGHAHLEMISFADVTPTDFLQIIANFKMSSQSSEE